MKTMERVLSESKTVTDIIMKGLAEACRVDRREPKFPSDAGDYVLTISFRDDTAIILCMTNSGKLVKLIVWDLEKHAKSEIEIEF